jgi:hypothetical protein
MSWGSPVSIVSDYGLDNCVIRVLSPAEAQRIFFSSLCPDQLWGPPSLLPNGYQGSFLWVQSAATVWHWPLTPFCCWGHKWVEATPPLPLCLHRCVVGMLYLYKSAWCHKPQDQHQSTSSPAARTSNLILYIFLYKGARQCTSDVAIMTEQSNQRKIPHGKNTHTSFCYEEQRINLIWL